jgi:hypothetical protein
MSRARPSVRIILLLWSMFCAHGQNRGSEKVLSLIPTTEPIKIDGVLREAAWRNAAFVELIQQSPRPGEPTPYRTVVRILLAGDNLLFGFECTDPAPNRIAVHSMRRDADFTGDDTVTIVLDTYGDEKQGICSRSMPPVRALMGSSPD